MSKQYVKRYDYLLKSVLCVPYLIFLCPKLRKSSLFAQYPDGKKTQGKLFGRPLAETTQGSMVSKPVRELLSIMFSEGPYTRGIFRKSADARSVEALKQRLDDGEDCLTNEKWHPLVIGSILMVCANATHI